MVTILTFGWAAVAWGCIGLAALAQAQPISGAGGTFPAPIYARWAEAAHYSIGIDLLYQAIGSGAGQDKVISGGVDFGASDAPMTASRLAEADLLQFPTVVGAVVVIVNLPDVRDGELQLTGEVLADIFLGTIVKWNDRRLAELNPNIALPDALIAPIHRAERSGTTFVFTSYLSAVSTKWKSQAAAGTEVKWTVGAGARGNDGVANTVSVVRGSIGYVENSYATENRLSTVRLRNRSGVFVRPLMANFVAAAAAGDWNTPDFAVSLVDTEGQANWPIVSTTFILVPKTPKDPVRGAAVIKFFDWAFRDGGPAAEGLGYITLPPAVQDAIRAAWRKQVRIGGEPVPR